MTEVLFRNRFRIPSSRLPGWNYRRGSYCVTVCTHEKVCWLGEVRQGEVILSDLGVIVAERWAGIAQHCASVRLDEWVVMPNHLHGILHLEPSPVPEPAQTLGQIMGGFKAASSRRIWLAGHKGFRWQSRFYDQLIRDDEALFNFRRYILDNPRRWDDDRYHPQT